MGVLLHVVDLLLEAQEDGLVGEHVVIVLFVGHEVVADRQESFEDGLVDCGQEVDVASCHRKFRSQRAVGAGLCGLWSQWKRGGPLGR